MLSLYIVDPAQSSGSRRSVSTFASQLQKMVKDQLLDCACVLIFDPDSHRLLDLNEDLAFDQFAKMVSSGTDGIAARQSGDFDRAFDLGKLLSSGDVAGVVTGLASTPAGLSAVEAAVIASRREIIANLQALASAGDTTETIMHQAIASNYWIFGGQYIGIAPRRDFTFLDQYDYPLLCSDGSIQIVEFKGPRASLVRRHRNHLIVTNEVHEATSQCLNYLRALDEQGLGLQGTYHNEFGMDIDFRRARGTVIIGNLDPGEESSIAPFQVVQTIRSYNAHLSRIQVVTYSELLDSAERALQFEYQNEKNSTSE